MADYPPHTCERLAKSQDAGDGPGCPFAGVAGLGKSGFAAWLAHDLRVQTAFSDGIYWLTFGQEARAITQLVRLAEQVGVPRDDVDRRRDDVDGVSELIGHRLERLSCVRRRRLLR